MEDDQMFREATGILKLVALGAHHVCVPHFKLTAKITVGDFDF